MRNATFLKRACALAGGAVLTLTMLVQPAAAVGTGPGVREIQTSDTGELRSAAVAERGLRGVSSYSGTGVPADVTRFGATPVAAGHQISPRGDVGVQSIIPPDTRYPIAGTTGFPASASVLITRTVGGVERHHCTGWMFGPSLVLTAGHCVFDHGGVGWYTGQLRFYPGRNGSASPYGSCTAAQLVSNTGWTNNGSADADYGGARLSCTIGNSTGWYGAWWQNASLNGTPTIIQGYPGDKPMTQWGANDHVRDTTALRVYYDNDTVGGNSGSAVHQDRPAGSPFCAGRCSMAFHAYGVGGGSHNSGPRITESRFGLMLGWR